MIRALSLEASLGKTAHVVVDARSGGNDALIYGVGPPSKLDKVTCQLERAVRVARMHEATAPRADLVGLKLQLHGELAAGVQGDALGRALELVVVVADRLARKVPVPIVGDDLSARPVRVLGQFEDPHLLSGVLKGIERSAGPDEAGLGARWVLDNGAVQSLEPLWSADQSKVGRAEVHFPVLRASDPPDLRSVEVFTRRVPPQLGETHVVAPRVNMAFRSRVEAVLRAGRAAGEEPAQAWRTTVVFRDELPVGESWNLALAMADRIARSVEWPMGNGGRLIATGKVDTEEQLGAVKAVSMRLGGDEAHEPGSKLALLKDRLQGNDVVLLPAPLVQDNEVQSFLQTLGQRAEPPTVLFLDHIVPASLRAASPPP